MSEPRRTFVPAAGHDWLLALYDPIAKLSGIDAARRALIENAEFRPNHRVLDIGCGTGGLVVLIKQLHPDVDVVGLDPDPKALARATRKVQRAKVSVRFDQGFSDELPFPDAFFDHVFSSFMFHHLEPEVKEKTLREVRRVLKPGSFLHMLDFAGPESNPHSLLAALLHFSHRLNDNFGSRILTFMSQAGLANPKEVNQGSSLFGPIAYYQASVHGSEGRS